jgi:hypothetical protein
MSDNKLRKRKHAAFFYDSELATLEHVFTRLGKGLGDFSKAALRDLLCLHYNLPHEQRGDPKKVFAGLQLALCTLRTILRHETGAHTSNPEFRKAVALIINGDPDGVTYEAVIGLRGLLDNILRFAERGA